MRDRQWELLMALAFASPGEVSPGERLKALQMLADLDPPAQSQSFDAGVEDFPEEQIDALLDTMLIVDVVVAVGSQRVVNGVDPESFPATAEAMHQLLREAEQRGERRAHTRSAHFGDADREIL